MLRVTLYSYDPTAEPAWDPADAVDVDYVSLFNGGTHGPPALIAPGRQDGHKINPVARPGDEVLYINTSIVPAFRSERLDDED